MQPPFPKAVEPPSGEATPEWWIDPNKAEKDRLISEWERELLEYWQAQQGRILGKMPKSKLAELTALLALLDTDFWEAEERELLIVMLPKLAQATERGVSIYAEGLEAWGLGVDWTLPHTDAGKWAREYGGELIKGIGETTQKRIASVLEIWWEMPDATLPDLERVLRKDFGFSRSRARLIAITETTKSYNRGEMLAAEAVEAEGLFKQKKIWKTANDDIVCKLICAPMHLKEVIGARTAFDTPVGPLEVPPAHPGCRCGVSIVPIMERAD